MLVLPSGRCTAYACSVDAYPRRLILARQIAQEAKVHAMEASPEKKETYSSFGELAAGGVSVGVDVSIWGELGFVISA